MGNSLFEQCTRVVCAFVTPLLLGLFGLGLGFSSFGASIGRGGLGECTLGVSIAVLFGVATNSLGAGQPNPDTWPHRYAYRVKELKEPNGVKEVPDAPGPAHKPPERPQYPQVVLPLSTPIVPCLDPSPLLRTRIKTPYAPAGRMGKHQCCHWFDHRGVISVGNFLQICKFPKISG